jgi:acyl-CoA reductase-like NAD-dependent aldehyde dehydrogenase
MTAHADIEVRDPRTGEVEGLWPATSISALNAMLVEARAAQPAWAGQSIGARAAVLVALREAFAAHADAIAQCLERDTGRRAIARQEVRGVIVALERWAGQAESLAAPEGWTAGRSMPSVRHRGVDQPYPVVGVISPWNFPLTLAMIDTIPALLAGCAVAIKPSEVTPRFIAPAAAAIASVPGLSGVLHLLAGGGDVGASLIARADAVCFTGSVATGRKVATQAAGQLIPAFLELGGKDPLIVLKDAPLGPAVAAALRGSVLATGQACQSIERIYVARPLYGDFVRLLTQAADAARLNWPDIAKGEIGPLIFARQAEIIAAQLADARAKGARVLTGGEIERHGGGFWIRPTVVVDVGHDMTLMREETFGPIMPVMAFDSEEEAVALANDSAFGLSAAVFAGTIETAEAIALRLDAGAVSLNDAALTAFFHEAEKMSFKSSGLGGSRMGAAGFRRFLRRKALIANTGGPAPLAAFAEDA